MRLRKPEPTPYCEPVARLLTLGDPIPESQRNLTETPLADYQALGITIEHVPDLIRMVRDGKLFDDPGIAAYGPLHAARALAVLGAPDAVQEIIELTRRFDRMDADGWLELMPLTLAQFGESAIDPIARCYRDQRESFGARLFLGNALEHIALQSAAARGRVVRVFMEMLAYARYNDAGINGDVIGALTELQASEALPIIRAAYETGNVDLMICGRLAEVEAEIVMEPEARRIKREADTARIKAELESEDALLGDMVDMEPVSELPDIVVRKRSAEGLDRVTGAGVPADER